MHRLSTELVDREGKNGSLCGYLFLFLRKQFAEQKTDEGSAVHELPEEGNRDVVWSQTATNSFPAFLNSSVAIKLIIGHIIAIIIMEIASVITIGRSCGVTMQKANL